MGFDTGGVGSDYDHKSAAAMRDFLATREVALEERDTNRHDDQTNQDDLIDEYTI